MAVPLISHPFRLQPSGRIATLDDMSDAYLAERLSLLVTIEPGEREAVPLFGINDPSFDDLPMSALESQVTIFDIPVTIVDVERRVVSETRNDYRIEFDVKPPEEDDLDG